MGTLVVQAHPLVESCNAALLERVRTGLENAGEPHDVFRIGEREHPTPRHLSGTERLVLVYPTWWGGQPAMLLDWIQRMVAADAFRSVRQLEAVTTLGSSRFVNTIQGQWGRRYLAKRVLRACTPGAVFAWHALYKIDRRTQSEIDAFLALVEEYFSGALSPA